MRPVFLPRVLLSLLPALTPGSGGAQVQATPPKADSAWNSPRVLDLVRNARQLRQRSSVDPEFRSYTSQARGFVYFFLDREDTGERILVKTDQIALEVHWQAPDRTRQRIVGLRDEKALPTNIRYHLDHLVVVQDDFGDRIRIGDGDEVEAVIHPVAPGSEGVYDFLLADSVSLMLQGGRQDTVRVYEVQVRPKDFDLPGYVGNVFLDRDTGAIVRLAFTFTPASYEDPYLDHIRISLENGLWEGKHWLPYRQELEIRREVPYLDFPAGSVIRGWFEIRNYDINPPLPPQHFTGPTITALPEDARRAFPFEDSLHAHLEEEGLAGLGPPPSMEEIRALAMEIARDRYLSGLRKLRLFLPHPTISSALRFNRAEGLFLGGGFSYGVTPGLALRLHGGFALGRERPALQASLFGGERYPDTRLEGFWNRSLELGPLPAISGTLNTLAALALDQDHLDLFFATGARVVHGWTPRQGWSGTIEARWEEHRRARDVVSSDSTRPRFRPVLPTEEGRWSSMALGVSFPMPIPGVRAEASLLGGRFAEAGFGSFTAAATLRRDLTTRAWGVEGELRGGLLLGAPPLQAFYLLGGRGSIPGYSFRGQTGDRFWFVRGEASRALFHPWARVRLLGAAGHAWRGGSTRALLLPDAGQTRPLSSLGLGLGLGWDILRLDLSRGLGAGGDWELVLSVNRDFWAWL